MADGNEKDKKIKNKEKKKEIERKKEISSENSGTVYV